MPDSLHEEPEPRASQAASKYMSAHYGDNLRLASKLGDDSFIDKYLPRLPMETINSQDEDGNTALHEAASHGRLQQVDKLLRKGALVSPQNRIGRVPLHLAAENGHDAVITRLLTSEASPASQDNSSQTPLHLATIAGREKAVKALLSANQPGVLDIKDAQSCTALFYALRNHEWTTASLIKGAGAKIDEPYSDGQTLLHQMAFYGDTEAAQILIRLGADVKVRNSEDLSPLYVAAQAGHIETFELLLGRGAKDEVTCGDGGKGLLRRAIYDGSSTALGLLLGAYPSGPLKRKTISSLLVFAAKRNHPQIVRTLSRQVPSRDRRASLIEAVGENEAAAAAILFKVCYPPPSLIEQSHPTALYMAVEANHELVARALVAAGANVQANDEKGESLLHQAVRKNNRDAVELLLELDADIHAEDQFGRTPLHFAAEHGPLVIKSLIDADPDFTNQDNRGQTALHVAADRGHLQALASLIDDDSFSSVKDIVDDRGQTALHLSTESDNFEAACMLIDEGADVNIGDRHGRTALHIAAEKGRIRILERLLAANADKEATDKLGRSPSYLARSSGNAKSISALKRSSRRFELIPSTQNEYFIHLHKFVKHKLPSIIRIDDPIINILAKKATIIVPRFLKRFRDVVSEGDEAGLVKLMLYDVAILCEVTSSLRRGGKQVDANSESTARKTTENSSSTDVDKSGSDVHCDEAVSEPISIQGLEAISKVDEACVNQDLEESIAQRTDDGSSVTLLGLSSPTAKSNPLKRSRDHFGELMVTKRIKSNGFRKPLIVFIITDEENDGTTHDTFRKQWREDLTVCDGSVLTLTSNVSRSSSTRSLLDKLEEDQSLKSSFSFSEGLGDIITALAMQGRKNADKFNADLLRLLLRPSAKLLEVMEEEE
ncbi:hypothetical protein CP533_5013 [Ophiocordyceps camponoti-saundersi (nom. inval.)]|nr:hypothetical protein CP533_5013 [Ophiocordyceps camponoti-saundersi (nom. inval.)]